MGSIDDAIETDNEDVHGITRNFKSYAANHTRGVLRTTFKTMFLVGIGVMLSYVCYTPDTNVNTSKPEAINYVTASKDISDTTYSGTSHSSPLSTGKISSYDTNYASNN